LNGLSILIIRQAGEGGMLYGSVSGRDVADAIKEAGFTVERRQVALDNPIKSLGTAQVRVSLHPEVAVTVKVTVARSQEEAERAARSAAETTVAVAVEEEVEESEEIAEDVPADEPEA
jgi:large subunit ribosomal protein L9